MGEWGKQRQDLDLQERERSSGRCRQKAEARIDYGWIPTPTRRHDHLRACTDIQRQAQDQIHAQSLGPDPHKATKPMPFCSPPPPILNSWRPDHHLLRGV